MIVSKFNFPDLDAGQAAERVLRATLDRIANTTKECVFVNVQRGDETILVVRSESKCTHEIVSDALNQIKNDVA